MKKLMIGILGLSMLAACNSGSNEDAGNNANASSSAAIVKEDIPVEIAAEMINKGDIVLVDVRSADEYASGHIEGALNIDVNSDGFEEKTEKLDKSKSYVVYCQSGRRSARSAEIMIDLGFKTVYNVDGGISQWKSNGYDVIVE